MSPIQQFQFCPKCGAPRRDFAGGSPFHCPACGFHYYFNPAVAVGGFVLGTDGRLLFIRRAKDPAKGKLAVPGGFVDISETAEEALRREVREEVNVELGAFEYVCSHPNSYHYRDVTYPVLDLFFAARIKSGEASAHDGVESVCWVEPTQADPAEMAFPSMREALRIYLALRKPQER
jgi:ADP-ribose pyrophosphatase YjhB (NUDIX family)